MKRRDFLANWGLSSLKINLGVLEGEFNPQDSDRTAAWELYIELLTRIATQHLEPDAGNEKAALDSIYAIFPITRIILQKHGPNCGEFSKIAIPVLNQKLRPFTAKWHKRSLEGALDDKDQCDEFRKELAELQVVMKSYTQALSALAGVEDLTSLEEE